jgi:hypothetical protein
MEHALARCWYLDIITVVPAGNGGGEESLDVRTPQNHGSHNSALITVGGVNNRGVLWPSTSIDIDKGGSITVYAVSKNVMCAS